MPDVGVLQLTIQDNSTQAEEGLNRLADALTRVKEAVGDGLKLAGVATQIKKIAKVIDEEVHGSTIAKLTEFGQALSSLKGLGNININLRNTERLIQATDAVQNAVEATSTSQNEIGSGFETAGAKIQEMNSDLQEVSTTMEQVDNSVNNSNWAEQFDPSKLPLDRLGDRMDESTREMRQYGDMVRDSTSAVSDMAQGVTAIIPYQENLENSWENICKRTHEAARIQKEEYERACEDALEDARKIAAEMNRKYSPLPERTFEDYYYGFRYRRTEDGRDERYKVDNDRMANALRGEGTPKETQWVMDHVSKQLGITIDELKQKIKDAANMANVNGQKTRVFSSLEEAAKSLGITLDEAKKKVYDVNSAINGAGVSGGGNGQKLPVFSSLEEAAKALGISLDEVKKKVYDVNNVVSGTGTAGGRSVGGSSNIFSYVEEESEVARTLIDMLRDKISILQNEIDTGMNEKGKILSEKAIVNNEIQVERLTRLVEDLQNKIKAGASVKNSDFVGNLGNYSQIDLMTMKLNGMKQALMDDINANKLNTQQIAERGMKINSLAEKIEKLKDAQDEVKSSTNGLKSVWDNMKKKIDGLFPSIGKLISQFVRIAKYRMIRSVLKHITSGFSEGLENVYNYSRLVGSGFAPAMDSAASSILQMKNSLGAALTPLIQALIPVLQTVVNWFITLVNYANQFIALITGQQTWTHALEATTTAYKDQTKAAKGASAAVKDLLADWDELNIIQSESGGGVGGGAKKEAEDFLSMFEQLDKFDDKVKKIVDFIKDNFDQIKKTALGIGAAILAWKLSSLFTGALGTLLGLASAGIVMGVAWDITTYVDHKYLETGEEGWLVADALSNFVGATLAGTIIETVLGGGTGLIGAGIELTVSGAISYGIAYANADNDRAKALEKLAAIKTAIGLMAMAAGFGIASGSVALGLLSALAVGAPLFVLSAGVTIVVEQWEKATAIAKKAFAGTGEGGISTEEIFKALQDEMDQATAGYGVVINAFSNVSSLKTNLADSFATIGQLSAVVRGDGKLTQDEAEAFKSAWTTVFDAFNGITADSFNTVFEGLNKSLSSESETIRETAKEIRVSMLMAKKQMDQVMAELQVEQEELASKIGKGTASEEEITKYFTNLEMLAKATRNSVTQFEDVVSGSVNIDFGDPENAVQNAVDFLKKANEASTAARDEIEAGYQSEMEGLEEVWRRIQLSKDLGKISDAEYIVYKKLFDDTRKNFTEEAEREKKKVTDSMQSTYISIINQALSGMANIPNLMDENGNLDFLNTAAYMSEIMVPLLSGAKEAGAEFSEDFGKMFGIGINVEDWISEGWAKKLEEYIKEEILDLGHDNPEVVKPEVEVEPEVKMSDRQITNAINDAIWDADTNITTNLLEGLASEYGLDLQDVLNRIEIENITDDAIEKLREVVDLINKNKKIELEFNTNVGETTGTNVPNIHAASNAGYNGIDTPISDTPYRTGSEDFAAYMRSINPANQNQQPTDVEVVNMAGDVQTGVQNGMKGMQTDQNSLLNQLITICNKIANKQWTVNVGPSPMWGLMNARSGQAAARVTGEDNP